MDVWDFPRISSPSRGPPDCWPSSLLHLSSACLGWPSPESSTISQGSNRSQREVKHTHTHINCGDREREKESEREIIKKKERTEEGGWKGEAQRERRNDSEGMQKV